MSAHGTLMKDILEGRSPASIFKQCLLANPSLTNADISASFKEQFDLVSTDAMQAIWHWQRPGSNRGVDDKRVDQLLFHYLVEAGYQIRQSQGPQFGP